MVVEHPKNKVLIPLLVDDPLWALLVLQDTIVLILVLIPLLVDDPLWVAYSQMIDNNGLSVLIPLLVDDPLWALSESVLKIVSILSLNPSFSG